MHPRNQNAAGYDFAALTATSAALAKFIKTTPAGTPSIDFANPAAVKALNRAILMHHYGVKGWDIPEGYLCPPIPGRADYLHSVADLLASCNKKNIPAGPGVRVLDIGTGANLVYPLIGHAEYGWSFLGVDIDEAALANAQKILAKNPELAGSIELRHQAVWDNIFTGLLRSGEQITEQALTDKLRAQDIVLLGELHDNAHHHALRAGLISILLFALFYVNWTQGWITADTLDLYN